MVTLWISRQRSDFDLMQDVCESITVIDPDCIMDVPKPVRVFGKCRRRLTFRIRTTEEAAAQVHDGLVAVGLVYVETDNGFIPIKTWTPQGDDIELGTGNLSRGKWQGPLIYPTNASLAARQRRLEQIRALSPPPRVQIRHPKTRRDRSKSLRELSR